MKTVTVEEETEIKNADSHIILYCKKWYKRTKLIEDLKILLGERCGCEPEYIQMSDIITVLFGILERYKKPIWFFINELCTDSFRWKQRITIKDLIMTLTVHIGLLKVKDDGKVLIELDKPDYNLLLKKKK